MIRLFTYLLCLLLLVSGVSADDHASDTKASSKQTYEQSQALRSKGLQAYKAGDKKLAITHFQEALLGQPTNPAILNNIILLALEEKDTNLVFKTVSQYLDLGIVPAVGIIRSLNRSSDRAKFKPLLTRVKQNRKAVGAEGVHQILPADLALVEGIAYHKRISFYSTVAGKKIYRVDGQNNQEQPVELLDGEREMLGNFFGIAYNPHDNLLYVTYADMNPRNIPKGQGVTGIVAIDPLMGTIHRNVTNIIPLSDKAYAGGKQISDLTITSDGSVFATDSAAGTVYKLDGNNLVQLIDYKSMRSGQGITMIGDMLMVADYGRGIWRMSQDGTGLGLLNNKSKTSLLGIDGLTSYKGHLIAVQNGVTPQRVIKLTLSETTHDITALEVIAAGLPSFAEPTLITNTSEGLLYVASSQWPKYNQILELHKGAEQSVTTILRIRP